MKKIINYLKTHLAQALALTFFISTVILSAPYFVSKKSNDHTNSNNESSSTASKELIRIEDCVNSKARLCEGSHEGQEAVRCISKSAECQHRANEYQKNITKRLNANGAILGMLNAKKFKPID